MPKPNRYYKKSTRDRGIKNKLVYGKEKVDYTKFFSKGGTKNAVKRKV